MSQKSVTIAVTACYDVCDQPDQWGPGTVLYNGTFNPQYNVSAPQKSLYQDFRVQLPEGWPTGESVLAVAHQFTVGVCISVIILVMGYTDVFMYRQVKSLSLITPRCISMLLIEHLF